MVEDESDGNQLFIKDDLLVDDLAVAVQDLLFLEDVLGAEVLVNLDGDLVLGVNQTVGYQL